MKYKTGAHLGEGITGVEEGELVPLEALDVLHHQREVGHRLETQLGLQRVQHVLKTEYIDYYVFSIFNIHFCQMYFEILALTTCVGCLVVEQFP